MSSVLFQCFSSIIVFLLMDTSYSFISPFVVTTGPVPCNDLIVQPVSTIGHIFLMHSSLKRLAILDHSLTIRAFQCHSDYSHQWWEYKVYFWNKRQNTSASS